MTADVLYMLVSCRLKICVSIIIEINERTRCRLTSRSARCLSLSAGRYLLTSVPGKIGLFLVVVFWDFFFNISDIDCNIDAKYQIKLKLF